MSEKRLEEIKKRLVLLHSAVDVDDEYKNYIFKDLKVEWLIEQAEKTEKYREALEFYANEKSWMNREVTILMDGEPTDVEDCPAIFDDGGNIARQALEGKMI